VIAKVSQGASGTVLMRYLFGPGRANEHSDQRVVASGIVMGVEEGRALAPLEIADLGAALDASNEIYDPRWVLWTLRRFDVSGTGWSRLGAVCMTRGAL
jgi:hypothetical protein